MKKIIGGVAATLILTGGLIYAVGTHTSDKSVCPDKPGYVCSKPKTEQVAQKTTAAAVDQRKDIGPNRPGCICK